MIGKGKEGGPSHISSDQLLENIGLDDDDDKSLLKKTALGLYQNIGDISLSLVRSELKRGSSNAVDLSSIIEDDLDVEHYLSVLKAEQASENITESDVQSFYENDIAAIYDVLQQEKGEARVTSTDVYDYLVQEGRKDFADKLQGAFSGVSKTEWQKFESKKRMEFNLRETSEISKELDRLQLEPHLLDDIDKVVADYSRKSGFKTAEKLDYFQEQLEKKLPNFEQAQIDQYAQVVGSLNDTVLAGAMKEGFEKGQTFSKRAEFMESARVKVAEYNQSLKEIDTLKGKLSKDPSLKDQLQELAGRYKTESAMYKDGFFSPNQYLKGLQQLAESNEKETKGAFEQIDSKGFSDVPNLPKKNLSYDEFRDELKKQNFYKLDKKQTDKQEVKNKIREKNEALYAQWQSERSTFLEKKKNNKKESVDTQAFVEESLLTLNMFATKLLKKKESFSSQKEFEEAFVKEHPDKKNLLRTKEGKAQLAKHWKAFEAFNVKENTKQAKASIKQVEKKKLKEIPDMPSKDLDYNQFRDVLKSNDFYALPEKQLKDPRVRKAVRKRTEKLHKEWKKENVKEAKITAKEQKETDKKVEAVNQGIMSVRLEDLGDIPDSVQSFQDFDRFLIQSKSYGLDQSMLESHPGIREALWEKNNSLYKQFVQESGLNEKNTSDILVENESTHESKKAVETIYAKGVDDLPDISLSVKTYAAFRDVLVKSDFYRLNKKSIQSSSDVREALWDQNNALFEAWKEQQKEDVKDAVEAKATQKKLEKDVQAGMFAIEQALFEDLPAIPAGISTYKQFTEVLVGESFYGLDQNVVDQSRTMREALWNKNNDLFHQWLDSKDFGPSLQSIYAKNTEDIPTMDADISTYEDFTQELIDTEFYGLDPEKIMASPEIREGLWEHNNVLYQSWKLEQNTDRVISVQLSDLPVMTDDIDSYEAFTETLIDQNVYGLDTADVKNSLALRTTLWQHNNELFKSWMGTLAPDRAEDVNSAIPETALAHNLDWEGLDDRLTVEQKDKALQRFDYLMDPTQFGLSTMLSTTDMPMAGFIFESIAHLPNNKFDEVVNALRSVSVERYNKQNMSEWLRVFTQTIGVDYIDVNMTGAIGELREDYQTYFKSSLDGDWTDVDDQGAVEEAHLLDEHDVANIEDPDFSDEAIEDVQNDVVEQPEDAQEEETEPEDIDEEVIGESVEEEVVEERDETESDIESNIEDETEEDGMSTEVVSDFVETTSDTQGVEESIVLDDIVEDEDEKEVEEDQDVVDDVIDEPVVVESEDSVLEDVPEEDISEPVIEKDETEEDAEELVNTKIDQSPVRKEVAAKEQLQDMDESSTAFQEQYLEGDYQVIGKVLEHIQSYAQYEFNIGATASIANEELRMIEIKGDSVRDIFSDIAHRLRQQNKTPQDFGVHVDVERFHIRMNGEVFDYPYSIIHSNE